MVLSVSLQSKGKATEDVGEVFPPLPRAFSNNLDIFT